MVTNSGKLGDVDVWTLPVVSSSWADFTTNDNRGAFTYSVVPIIYSISTSAVVTWFLTIFVLTNYTVKPSLILKASTSLSSIFLVIVVIRAVYTLHMQQTHGYFFGADLLDAVNGPLYLTIIDLVVVFLLQINQVQIIMRLFSRQNDKRLTLVVGVFASVSSQIIWGISKFYNFAPGSEAGDILPTFIYLTRTSMALCYAALISGFLILKINYILADKKIWLLTILTFVLIYCPVAFFISDVSNAFIYELSEVFSVVTYLICVVIPWEWCNKFNLIMKIKEKEGLLGRRFYEDELYELDGLELFVEESDEQDDDEENQPRRKPKKYRSLSRNKDQNQKLYSTYDKTKQIFLNITDTIIATGFAIPRSTSVATPYKDSPEEQNEEQQNEPGENPEDIPLDYIVRTQQDVVEQQQSNPARHRRDIYVYSTKQVVLNLSDEEAN